jgi:hypothetical protein
MTYIIRCKVSGGVTGTRESVCKGRNGEVLEYATKDEAAAQAKAWADSRNGNPYRTASFWYWADEQA